MSHEDIYKMFERSFDHMVKDVQRWEPSGANSVRIRLRNGNEYVFSFRGTDDWSLETTKSWRRSLRLRERRQGKPCLIS